ncbi:FtsX-like permease family protein [Streptomyces lushanensis]|uniref:FtsX-like permease family protein n=1 Tax=Streptomyces lushanensis TaxID=1434255 RepID=UPI00082E2091|nr:FtsX-like permease family protein [Streptomyces lushanensis]
MPPPSHGSAGARPREAGRVRAVAPWVRTRLRTAPGAAAALGALVLLTAFLAAAFPRAVDAYETDGLRREITGTPVSDTVLQLTAPQAGLEIPEPQRVEAMRPDALEALYRRAVASLPSPLRVDLAESAYGVRTGEPLTGTDDWLPRPDAIPPRFTLATQSELATHATVRSGRLPSAGRGADARTKEVEAAATTATARELRLRVGSVLRLSDRYGTRALTVRITGLVEPRHPEGSYWSAEPLLRAPGLNALPSRPPQLRWEAGLLLAPEAAPALLGTRTESERYWRLAPATGGLTAADAPELGRRIASLESGPDLLRMREIAGGNAVVETGLGAVVGSHLATREAISRIVVVAAFGIGTVAAVVLAMAGGLIAAGRAAELALLRSRGGSLPGIGGRLLAETAVIALPAAGAGLLLAVLAVDGGGDGSLGGVRLLPAVYGASAVALLACAALPLRAVPPLRGARAYGGRDDLTAARPSRRRTVAELTLLLLAVASVAALRRRGTANPSGGAGDLLVSAAPVLVALIAALVLVRLYPLPLRHAARSAARLRGAVGFLALARAGRSSSATAALPLLALLIALTTAAFGGSVLSGIADARDRAALLAVGADARISTPGDALPLPPGAEGAVREVAGVREVTPVRIDSVAEAVPAAGPGSAGSAAGTGAAGGSGSGAASDTGSGATEDPRKPVTLIGVEPDAYTRLARRTDLGAFPAGVLKARGRGGVLNAVASPAVAERLGTAPRRILSSAGGITVRITTVRSHTPAAPRSDFLLVDSAALTAAKPTTLLVTGERLDGEELRAAIEGLQGSRTPGRGAGASSAPSSSSSPSSSPSSSLSSASSASASEVSLRSEERASFTASPLQSGAERIYAVAALAGAAYAVVALLLSFLHAAPERTALLSRLRTMGLTTRQGRLLLGLEALPQALLAAGGGVLVGWATIRLLAPGIDLAQLAVASASASVVGDVSLSTDVWSLALPAGGVLVLAGAVAAGQAWRAGRRGSITELRAGDTR